MRSSVQIDAKINSFITRKLATMGESIPEVVPETDHMLGIYYEKTKPAKEAKG